MNTENIASDQNQNDVRAKLANAGLRPTRQRLALAELLFADGDRHLAAEDLHREAIDVGIAVSLATVYNTLHQFNEAGLLRVLAIEGNRTYFDTNISDHHHFYVEDTQEVIDLPGGDMVLGSMPTLPEGMEISHVDIVIRVRRKK